MIRQNGLDKRFPQRWQQKALGTFFILSCVSLISACSADRLQVKANMTPSTSADTATSVAYKSAYSPERSQYGVIEVDGIELTTTRDRTLPLKVYAPDGDGPFPVIIFSHGTGASKDDYAELGEFWAARGYVSVHPSHADSLSLREGRANFRRLRSVLEGVLEDANQWVERGEDVALVARQLAEIERSSEQLSGKLDGDRVGIAGHSFGAYGAQVAGGAKVSLPNETETFELSPPENVKAVLLLSPQGTGQQGLTNESWRNFQLPMMVMTGLRDQGAQGQDYRWKTEPFELAPATSNKYLVILAQANHFSFGGRTQAEERRVGPLRQRRQASAQRTMDYVKFASLGFWDTYLNNNAQAQDYLLNELEEISGGEASVSFR